MSPDGKGKIPFVFPDFLRVFMHGDLLDRRHDVMFVVSSKSLAFCTREIHALSIVLDAFCGMLQVYPRINAPSLRSIRVPSPCSSFGIF